METTKVDELESRSPLHDSLKMNDSHKKSSPDNQPNLTRQSLNAIVATWQII
ncbi:hypothetical protein CsSME_00030950 [Camellia sinensis var. sinensis]